MNVQYDLIPEVPKFIVSKPPIQLNPMDTVSFKVDQSYFISNQYSDKSQGHHA